MARCYPSARSPQSAAIISRNVIVQAGHELDLGMQQMPFLKGTLEGTLTLSDGRSTAVPC